MADNDLANDLIGGVPAIAAFLGFSERQTYHLLEKGKLPAFKIGDRKWQARKSTLRRHIENLEAPRAQA
jgi:excisionase family DNA binding protein